MEITLHQCSVKIDNRSILEAITFKVVSGTFYRVKGKNGSGKTVLLNSLLGLTTLTGDYTISYDKQDVVYISDSPFYTDDEKVSHVIKSLCFFYDFSLEEVKQYLNFFEMEYDAIQHLKVGSLSYGTRKKLLLIPLLCYRMTFCVLDEIFTGLDEISQQRVIDVLKQRHSANHTILLVEHNEAIVSQLKKNIEMEEYECKEKTLQPL